MDGFIINTNYIFIDMMFGSVLAGSCSLHFRTVASKKVYNQFFQKCTKHVGYTKKLPAAEIKKKTKHLTTPNLTDMIGKLISGALFLNIGHFLN